LLLVVKSFVQDIKMNDLQKSMFLLSEGDAYFERNHQVNHSGTFDGNETVIQAITRVLPTILTGPARLLEIGCGEGKRLEYLSQHFGVKCHGIDPSAKAVAVAKAAGIQALQGTADKLPYEAGTFDIVVFGFCLYLCDRVDLFRIAQEADRVLKTEAWVVIHDFYATTPTRAEYHHKAGIFSYKMDYRRLFDWHPAYTCHAQELNHHGRGGFTDDPQEWVATSLIRKTKIG
jgi:SAM-dependent methyltransferase